MLRSVNARANIEIAVIELGSSSEDDDGEKEKEKDTGKVGVNIEVTNMTASEPGHTHGSLQSRCFHAPVGGCTC